MSQPAGAADVFRAIADPTRRAILDALRNGSHSASELHAPFQMSQPAFSQHLKVLRDAGLVNAKRAGRERLYVLVPSPLADVGRWLHPYQPFWRQKLRSLGALLDERRDRTKVRA